MINILYIITELNIGGAEKMLYDLVTRIDNNRFNISILSLQDDGYFGTMLKKQGINLITLGMKSKYDIFKLFKLKSIISNSQYDIIHSFMFHANIIARFCSFLFKVPVNISAVHTLEKGKRWHLFIDKITHSLVTYETVICNAAKEFMIKNTHIPPSKVHVIYNGIDVDQYKTIRFNNDIRQRFNLPVDKKIIGTIGSLTTPKGHYYFLQMMKVILKSRLDCFFVIVGSGELKKPLLKLIEQYKMSQHIRIIDRVIPITDILPTFDCFVLTSLWEGLPVSLLEAIAAHIPIVVTDVGGISEIITHKHNGILVKSKDFSSMAQHILNILDQPNYAQDLAQNAFDSIRNHFSIDRMVTETETLYDTISGG